MGLPPLPPPVSNPADDYRTSLVVAVSIPTAFAFCVLLLRILVRLRMAKALGYDDALMIFTMMLSAVGYSLIILETKHGAGRHKGDVDPASFTYGMKINYVNQSIFLYAFCFAKLSVGAMLARIAAVGSKWRLLIHLIMAFMFIYTVACHFTVLFICSDIRHNWDPSVPAACLSIPALYALSYTNAGINLLTDLAFSIIIPVPMLWELNISLRRKISLAFILGLGFFATCAASVRIYYLSGYGKQLDFLWDSRNISLWSVVELNVAIIAASLPAIKPLFKSIQGSLYSKSSRSKESSDSTKSSQAKPQGSNKSGTTRDDYKSTLCEEDGWGMEPTTTAESPTFPSRDSTISTRVGHEDSPDQPMRKLSHVKFSDSEIGVVGTTVTTTRCD